MDDQNEELTKDEKRIEEEEFSLPLEEAGEDNPSMEGKDLASDEKMEFEKKILEIISKLKTGQSTVSTEGLELTNYGGQYTLGLRLQNGDKEISITFGIIDKDGKFTYNKAKFEEVKQKLEESGMTLDDLGLPDLSKYIDLDEKGEKEEHEEEKDEEEKDDEKPELEDEEKDEEENEKIADEMGIDPKKIYRVKPDSQFYKNHPGIFKGKNVFFYERSDGKISVGTFDEQGHPIEDTEHFDAGSQVKAMQPVIRLGSGREDVKEQIPYQTISMKGIAKDKGEGDVQDRYIAVFKGPHGYLEFEEVEQPTNGEKPVSERIEVGGRRNNTKEMNQSINNSRGYNTPNTTSETYEESKKTPLADNGTQPEEALKEKEELKKKIQEDLLKKRGPMPQRALDDLTQEVEDALKEDVDYDKAITTAGIEEREEGGRTPGERRDRRADS